MNRLDLMPQTPSRSVESTQASRGLPSAADAQHSGQTAGSAMAEFDSVLEGFSREQGRESVEPSQNESLLNLTGQPAEAPAIDTTALQALLSATSMDGASAGAAVPPPGSQAYSVLESLLPRILSQTGAGGSSDREARGNGSSMLPMLASDATADSILSPAIGPKLLIAVQNQETHFRPVVEGFETALQEGLPAEAIDLPAEAMAKDPIVKLPLGNMQALSGDKPVVPNTGMSPERQSNEERSFDRVSVDHMTDRAEVQKQTAPVPQRPDGGSLPAGTLHQMARAILDDVSGISGPHDPSYQSDGVQRVALARASGGVLRVLSLQLNPVELGLVTVKMRLSGDSLEMELQVEKQETAELLRNDAEKLSSLLRTSGYRPDVITIQTTESTNHDRNSFQRLQGGTEDQNFQGNTGNQGHSSGQHHGQYGPKEAELPNEPKQDRASGRSSSGGVYL